MPDTFDKVLKLVEAVSGVGDGLALLAVALFWVGVLWIVAQLIQTVIVKWL